MRRVALGLVGYGSWGKRHYRTLRSNPRIKLVGVYDPAYNGRKFYRSLRALIRDVDALDIVVPPRHLCRVATEALERGRHVLIEKPVAANLRDAMAVRRLWKRSGCKAMAGFIERFNPVFNAIRIITKRSAPTAIFCQRSGTPTLVAKETGALKDLAIHDVDLLRWMFGEPRKASGLEYHGGHMGYVHLAYDRFDATIVSDCLGPGKIRRWILQFGAAENITAMFEDAAWKLYEGSRELRVPWIAPLSLELGHFARCILEDLEPSPGIEDAVRALRILETMKRIQA